MKRLFVALITGGFAAVSLPGCTQPVCGAVVVRAQVEAAQGALNLADLLAPGTCPPLYREAAQVSLGRVPRAGSVRVLDGRQIRRLLEDFGNLVFGGLASGDHGSGERGMNLAKDDNQRIPERVVVRQAGAVKTCAEIAKFISRSERSLDVTEASEWGDSLDCAAARNIPKNSSLELLKTTWNAGLERREFALRCGHPEDCVPFLVWTHEKPPASRVPRSVPSRKSENPAANGSDIVQLIKPGQTAMLTWEQAGIRLVLPVTCLEAGGFGQFIRVRFKNANRTMRAEIIGAGTLRASL